MKKVFAIALALALCLTTAFAADYSDVFTNYDQRDNWTEAVIITFTDDSVSINGSGASADGTVVYITAPGTYMLSGVNDKNVPVVMTCALVLSFVFMLAMVLLDVAYAIVDPKIRARYKK